MITYVLLPLALLIVLYGAIILGLVWVLRWAIWLGFLGFGLGTGLFAARLWPFDSSILPNVWATLLGDALYHWSTSIVGDLWLLDVPRVYVTAAILLYGGLGSMMQWVYRRYELAASRARAAGDH